MIRLNPQKRALGALFTLAILLGFSTPAHAVFTLRLTSGGGPGPSSITVTDNGSGDLNSLVTGQIIFSGPVGGWEVNTEVGSTMPFLPNDETGMMNVLAIASNPDNGPISPLVIELSEVGFVAPGDGLRIVQSMFNSSTEVNVNITFETFVSTRNELFDYDLIADGDGQAFTTGVQEGEVDDWNLSISVPLTTPYSITQRVTITPLGQIGTMGSFDGSSIVSVPEPATMVLGLMGGIPLLAGTWLRRRRARTAS